MYLFLTCILWQCVCVSCEAAGSGVLVWVWSKYSHLPFLWGDPKQHHQSPSTQYSLLTCTIPHIPQWPTATKDCLLCLATEAYPVSRQAYKAKKKKRQKNLKMSCHFSLLAVFVQLLVARKGKEIAGRTVGWSTRVRINQTASCCCCQLLDLT